MNTKHQPLRFASVCSGIEAASAAWHRLGWQCRFVSEIEAFPCAVLKEHYPDVPNYGDMTKYHEWPLTKLDVLVGGTPCQAFSVAGLRKGLADPRGNLALTFLGIVDRYRPAWVVWENVPGVHSSWSDVATHAAAEESCADVEAARRLVIESGIDLGTGFGLGEFEEVDQSNDFDCFLGGLEQLGYGVAYRILDAQYFGVAQRRRRVFVVGHIGGQWQRAAAVLFERESLSWDPAPRREPGKRVAACVRGGTESGSNEPHDKIGVGVAKTILGKHNSSHAADQETYISESAPTISARSKGGGGLGTDCDCDGGRGDSHQLETRQDGTANAILTPNGGRGGVGVGAVAVPFNSNRELQPGKDARAGRMRGREGCDGGGKGPLLSEDQSLTLAANANDQVLFQPAQNPIAFHKELSGTQCVAESEVSQTLKQGPMAVAQPIAFSAKDYGADAGEIGPTLKAGGHNKTHANSGNWIGIAQEVAPCIKGNRNKNSDARMEANGLVAHALRADGFDASEDGTGRGTPIVHVEVEQPPAARRPPPNCRKLSAHSRTAHTTEADSTDRTLTRDESSQPLQLPEVAWAIQERDAKGADSSTKVGHLIPTQGGFFRQRHAAPNGGDSCNSSLHDNEAIAFSGRARGDDGRGYERGPNVSGDKVGAIDTVKPSNVAHGMAVRRLTPRECERLQGFPDDYTHIPIRDKKTGAALPGKFAADGPRYKALGNSMAVPVMRWLGQRIEFVESLINGASLRARPTEEPAT